MSEAVTTDLVIAGLQISDISDAELEGALHSVLEGHKDAIASIRNSMEEADYVYRKYLDADYIPEEDVAKKDRAILNKEEKNIAEKYAELKDAYMKPLEDIDLNIKVIRKAIKAASDVVDKAVKTYEETVKSKKRREINDYFISKKFELVPLERIWDDKWLNKGAKPKDIMEQIDAAIAKIYGDIQVLERMPDHGMTAKAMYLETLDMGAALRKVDVLKENAEHLAKEEANRQTRQAQEQCDRNAAAERHEFQEKKREEIISTKIDEAMHLEHGTTAKEAREEIIEFTMTFKGTKDQLLKLREYMSANGIPYQKGLLLESEDHARQIAKKRNLDTKIYSFIYVPAA